MDKATGAAIACLYCGQTEGQIKSGLSQGGQRYKCTLCQRRYILDRRERGYSSELREQAVQLHRQGMKDRQIARQLNVSAPTVGYWLRLAREAEPPGPLQTSILPVTALSVESVSGREKATIHDVARLAQVSAATVSNYLNNKGRMREETRSRISAAVEQLHFSPNALTRAIRQRQTRILGVLLIGYPLSQDVGASIVTPLLAGINMAADRAQYHILLYTGWPHRPEMASGLSFLDGTADGVIWVSPNLDEPVLNRIAAAGLPVIATLTRQVPEPVGYVDLDNFGAMGLLVRHLVEQGHRRIAFVGPIYNSNFQDRRDGYRQALLAHGLTWDPSLEITDIPISADQPETVSLLQRCLSHSSPPTAMLVCSDGYARAIIKSLEECGVRVPEQMAVCGFDDVPDARIIGGGLTTITQPFHHIGERAVDRLIALIEGAPVDQCRVSLTGSLIVRRSTLSTTLSHP